MQGRRCLIQMVPVSIFHPYSFKLSSAITMRIEKMMSRKNYSFIVLPLRTYWNDRSILWRKSAQRNIMDWNFNGCQLPNDVGIRYTLSAVQSLSRASLHTSLT